MSWICGFLGLTPQFGSVNVAAQYIQNTSEDVADRSHDRMNIVDTEPECIGRSVTVRRQFASKIGLNETQPDNVIAFDQLRIEP